MIKGEDCAEGGGEKEGRLYETDSSGIHGEVKNIPQALKEWTRRKSKLFVGNAHREREN